MVGSPSPILGPTTDHDARGGLLAAAPPTAWRPSLAVTRLLDAVLGGARAPIGLVARGQAVVAPALIRVPAARVLTMQPWYAADLALLPTVAQFVGTRPAVTSLADAATAGLQTVLWLDPTLPVAAEQLQLVAAALAPDGRLAIALTAGPGPIAAAALLHLRHALRRAGWHSSPTMGFQGPRSLAWSARARLALAAGHPERYDRCHAAMRAAYAETWPLALLCRVVVVTARRAGPPARPGWTSPC
jgi:hypothetical protein